MTYQKKEYSTKIENLKNSFYSFATTLCEHLDSTLYKNLSLSIANDREVLEIAVPVHRKPLHLFFAAVHYSLLRQPAHPLAEFYPSISKRTTKDKNPYPHFREFCFENRAEIQRIITKRSVQTNYPHRCSFLLPAFNHVYAHSRELPLAIVEMGASAGLNLLWDYYAYDYGIDKVIGDINSQVQINCKLHGNYTPPLKKELPQIEYRVGIDLNPLNVKKPEDVLWLRSLIWPEHQEQANVFAQAVKLAQRKTIDLVKGNILDVLSSVVENVPPRTALCLFNSYTLYQITEQDKKHLELLIETIAIKRNLFWISVEWHDALSPSIKLTSYINGVSKESLLGRCSVQGHWLEWLQK